MSPTKPSGSKTSTKVEDFSSSANTTTDNNPTEGVTPVDPGDKLEGNTNHGAGNAVSVGSGSTRIIVQGTPVEDRVEDVKPKSELRDANFHYPTELDPMRQVPGTSNYLDRVQRVEAEIQRAKVEGRKPDLENPPAMQSTPLVEERRLAQTNTIPVDKEPDVVAKISHAVYPDDKK